jgi:hypothetical protein
MLVRISSTSEMLVAPGALMHGPHTTPDLLISSVRHDDRVDWLTNETRLS